MADDKQVVIPLSVIADALDCFWNPAVNAIRDASYHGPASGADVVGAIANGLAAVASSLREHANEQRIDAPAAVPVDGHMRLAIEAAIPHMLNEHQENCRTCEGSGVDPGGKPACRDCIGRDQIDTQLGYTLSDIHEAYSRGKLDGIAAATSMPTHPQPAAAKDGDA